MFLLRDLVSPRTWLAMISHLAGLFLGIAIMVVVVTGLSLGFSLLVLALTGLPILGLTLRAATWCAAATPSMPCTVRLTCSRVTESA